MKWVDGLRLWRKKRGMKEPSGAFIVMVQEELQEYIDAISSNNVHGVIDALADIIVLATNEMELENYNVDLCMKQVVKHISARTQCPIQKSAWELNGPSGKWFKDPNQDPSSIPEPDYTLCRLSSES